MGYEGTNVVYLWGQKKGKYHEDMVWLLEDLLYKEIPLTLYVNNEQIMEGGMNVCSLG
jgi:hypothetical protein